VPGTKRAAPPKPVVPKAGEPKKITYIFFTDEKNYRIKNAKYGDTVRAHFGSTGLIGHNVKMKVYDDEVMGKPHFLAETPEFTIKESPCYVDIILTKSMQEKGGNVFYDEVYVDIEIMETKAHVKSTQIFVKNNSFKPDIPDNVTKHKVGAGDDPKKSNKNGICEYEARVRAFMRMLRVKEGTIGESGYTKLFGNSDFTAAPYNKTMDTHPDISIPFGNSSSDAAGAYQMMGTTYNDTSFRTYKSKYNVTKFDAESQDKLCLIILKHNYTTDRPKTFYEPKYPLDKAKTKFDTVREEKDKEWRKRFKGQQADIIQLIINDDIKRAALLASLCWASLPDSPYGQQSATYKYEDVKKIYDGYLKEELEVTNKELHLKKGFLREFGYACCIPINAPDGIVTYRIYQDGIIEKHIPKTIKKGFENKLKYVYHGSKNVQNEICIVDWHETNEKAISKSKLYSKPTHSEIVTDEIVADGQTTRRVIYTNGDIAEYGSNDGDTFWRLYKALDNKIKLIEMPETVKFIKYKFSNTKRKYTGPDEYAAFVGALAKTGLEITTTGSCFKEGSCFPSQYHVNGRSVDTIYFWDQKNDQEFIDAMKFYHFKELKVGNDKYFKSLKNVQDGGNLHDSHLHSGNFKSSSILIIK
jgi:muramidase (phage lysozyme)